MTSTSTAQIAGSAAIDGNGHNALTDPLAVRSRSGTYNDADRFMTQCHRAMDPFVTRVLTPCMHIAAAEAAGQCLDQELSGSRVGLGMLLHPHVFR